MRIARDNMQINFNIKQLIQHSLLTLFYELTQENKILS